MKCRLAMIVLALSASTAALAQQAPPVGITPPQLVDQTYVFDTAEVHSIAVTVLTKDFARPFALDFLPNGDLLVSERTGNLRIIHAATAVDAAMADETISGMPLPGTAQGSFGLHDIAVHPDFANNHLLYWTWNAPVPNAENPDEPPEQGRLQVMRGQLAGGALTGVEVIFDAGQPGYAGGSRVVLDGAGMVYVSTGAPFGPEGQMLASPYGKVLRLHEDGTIPADNPFARQAETQPGTAHPAIYSLGHRDQHGLVIHPGGTVFSAEHGPNGGDELNLIRPGGNYGWPAYTLGRNYDGTPMDVPMQGEGITDPLVAWLPSIAPSGLMFYTGDAFPAWQGNLFVGSGRHGEVNFTGGLERVVFNGQFGELRRETLLTPLHQRVRDMVQGPDGLIYVLTDGPENTVLRIAPSD